MYYRCTNPAPYNPLFYGLWAPLSTHSRIFVFGDKKSFFPSCGDAKNAGMAVAIRHSNRYNDGMYIIVGLGNPKTEYKNTRHNVGFDVIDMLSDKHGIPMDIKKHRAVCGKGMIEGEKVVLAQPQTFMNLSGLSVLELVHYYKIDPARELIIIYDDIDLSPGQIRIRKQGSAGGHNGMKSIIGGLNTMDFLRIRVGVGDKPKQYDLADYVLGHFTKEEREVVDEAIIRASEAVRLILTEGADAAMNLYNRKQEKDREQEQDDQ